MGRVVLEHCYLIGIIRTGGESTGSFRKIKDFAIQWLFFRERSSVNGTALIYRFYLLLNALVQRAFNSKITKGQ
jgi:hypothetical protein